MGTFQVAVEIANAVNRRRRATLDKVLVDTGSEYTWIPEAVLKRLQIAEEKRDLTFIMANGQNITRSVGFAILRVGEHFTIDEVVFARPGDLTLLGARTLEGLNLRVDARAKRLVAGGPLSAAGGRDA